MIANPFLGTPQQSGWAMGFAFGFLGPNFSDSLPAVVAPALAAWADIPKAVLTRPERKSRPWVSLEDGGTLVPRAKLRSELV
jgi:hypothetical protein